MRAPAAANRASPRAPARARKDAPPSSAPPPPPSPYDGASWSPTRDASLPATAPCAPSPGSSGAALRWASGRPAIGGGAAARPPPSPCGGPRAKQASPSGAFDLEASIADRQHVACCGTRRRASEVLLAVTARTPNAKVQLFGERRRQTFDSGQGTARESSCVSAAMDYADARCARGLRRLSTSVLHHTTDVRLALDTGPITPLLRKCGALDASDDIAHLAASRRPSRLASDRATRRTSSSRARARGSCCASSRRASCCAARTPSTASSP